MKYPVLKTAFVCLSLGAFLGVMVQDEDNENLLVPNDMQFGVSYIVFA